MNVRAINSSSRALLLAKRANQQKISRTNISWVVPLSWEDREIRYAFAASHGLGLEVAVFCSGIALNDERVRRERVAALKSELAGFSRTLTYHGAFIDVVPTSSDSAIAKVSRMRICQDLETATELGCSKVVFHTGFNPNVPGWGYMDEFVDSHIRFWPSLLEAYPDVTICLENSYESEPDLLAGIMRGVLHERFRVCLDLAHANVYSTSSLDTWMDKLSGWIAHMHWNDNYGDSDSHLPLGAGLISWEAVWEKMKMINYALSINLEVGTLSKVQSSLVHLASFGVRPSE